MAAQVATHKNLEEFHEWPARYRHWYLDVAEDQQHNIWVSTEGLREIYPYLVADKVLVTQYRSSMFYVKASKRYYLSERAMKLALHKSSTGHAEALKFLDWFERNISSAAAKKALIAHQDRTNEIRQEHGSTVRLGPLAPSSGALHLDATTIPEDSRQAWSKSREPGAPEKVFRIENLPVQTTWGQFTKQQLGTLARFLISVWRGERNLFVTLMIGIAIGMLPSRIDNLVVPDDLDVTKQFVRFYWSQIIFLAASIPAAIWFLVSMTRSTWRSFGIAGGKFWASTVFLLTIPLTSDILLSRFDLDLFEQWLDVVRGRYAPVAVWHDPHLGRIVVNGRLSFGSSEALQAVLDANPKVKLLQIESPGGRVIEGLRMAEIVADRKMDTVSMTSCASACTLILQAGQHRYLGPEVRVGFHRSGTRYGPVSSGWSTTDHYIARFYLSHGASEAFVKQALTPSIRGLWTPTHAQMLEAGYATHPWVERRVGY